MLTSLLSGIFFGLASGISPGPLLILVISESLTHGTRAGVKTALAPIITDTPIIIFTYLILDQLKEFNYFTGVLSICGACYIMYLAYEGWNSIPPEAGISGAESKGLRKAFVTNMLNPHPYIFWASVGTPFTIKAADESFLSAAVFLAAFYICILASKIFIAVLAGRYRKNFSRYYLIIQRVLSAALAVFAILFFYEGIKIFSSLHN
jgi:threonine/homoserine/homoserine lactone efflux protein